MFSAGLKVGFLTSLGQGVTFPAGGAGILLNRAMVGTRNQLYRCADCNRLELCCGRRPAWWRPVSTGRSCTWSGRGWTAPTLRRTSCSASVQFTAPTPPSLTATDSSRSSSFLNFSHFFNVFVTVDPGRVPSLASQGETATQLPRPPGARARHRLQGVVPAAGQVGRPRSYLFSLHTAQGVQWEGESGVVINCIA